MGADPVDPVDRTTSSGTVSYQGEKICIVQLSEQEIQACLTRHVQGSGQSMTVCAVTSKDTVL